MSAQREATLRALVGELRLKARVLEETPTVRHSYENGLIAGLTQAAAMLETALDAMPPMLPGAPKEAKP